MTKNYVDMLREMLDDVKARVAEAESRIANSEREISNIGEEQAASGQELKNIRSSFSLRDWLKAKLKKSGITAEEARQVAESYSQYANVVEQIADEETRMEEAKATLRKAENDAAKRELVQGKVEDLMDVLGLLDEE